MGRCVIEQGDVIAVANAADANGWMSGRTVPLDWRGPQNVAFTPFPDEWLEKRPLDLLIELAEQRPDRVVIDDGVTSLTYRQLSLATNNVAHALHARLAPGASVLALLRNTTNVTPMMFAARAAGILFVPLDMSAPAERKRALLEASGAQAVIFEAGSQPDLDFVTGDVQRIEIAIDAETVVPPLRLDLGGDALTAVAYTSGSTGRPKGVTYSAAHTMALVQRHINANHIGEDDVIAGVASLSAAGLREALCAVFSGAKLRPLDFARLGMAESMRVMAHDRVTVLSFVPSALRMLLQVPGIERAFAHLRLLDLVGESTSSQDLALFRQKLPRDCVIGIGFGSTETNIVFHWFVDDADVTGPIVPAGFLDVDRTIRIVDENGVPVKPGEPGALIVSDAVLTLGYHSVDHAGGIDGSRFRVAAGDPGPRTYDTGDVVRMRPDGLIEFVGRRDRMVKVRGLQVDLGEVEVSLASVEGVGDAVVVPVTGSDDSVTLTAFIRFDEGAAPVPVAALRARVARDTLPHMVPSRFVTVPVIPRLHNGKPDLVRLTKDAGTQP